MLSSLQANIIMKHFNMQLLFSFTVLLKALLNYDVKCSPFIIVGNFYAPDVFRLLLNKTKEGYQIVMDQFAPYITNVTTVFQILKNLYTVSSFHHGHGRESEDADFTKPNRGEGKFKQLVYHQNSRTKHQKSEVF